MAYTPSRTDEDPPTFEGDYETSPTDATIAIASGIDILRDWAIKNHDLETQGLLRGQNSMALATLIIMRLMHRGDYRDPLPK